MPLAPSTRDRAARLASYSTAVCASAVAATSASAGIVYSGPQNIAIGLYSSQDLNLDGDAYNDILLKNYVFGSYYQGATVNFTPGRLVAFYAGPNNFAYASALNYGDVIDSSTINPNITNVSLAYANNANSEFDNVTGAFIGLSFPGAGTGTIGTFYGWVRVDIDNAAGSFNIVDWAYNDVPGQGIFAGQTIPEPGALSLLAAGAIGLTRLRNRKEKTCS